MPAFSRAISASVVPSRSVCSSSMLVMQVRRGSRAQQHAGLDLEAGHLAQNLGLLVPGRISAGLRRKLVAQARALGGEESKGLVGHAVVDREQSDHPGSGAALVAQTLGEDPDLGQIEIVEQVPRQNEIEARLRRKLEQPRAGLGKGDPALSHGSAFSRQAVEEVGDEEPTIEIGKEVDVVSRRAAQIENRLAARRAKVFDPLAQRERGVVARSGEDTVLQDLRIGRFTIRSRSPAVRERAEQARRPRSAAPPSGHSARLSAWRGSKSGPSPCRCCP